jgi:transcriptional regulator with XRE-family HTH domain
MITSDVEFRTELGSKLKTAREYLGLSQEEVSRILGLARSAVSLIESGERKVNAAELKKFAEIYQKPLGYFTGEAAAPPESVAHLARLATELSQKDRQELLRFAEFLQSRKESKTRS